MKQKFKKIVLAYSGGLDTSVMITWLKENYDNCEVIAVVGNVGQGDSELIGIEEKALKTGASKIYVEDMKEELVNDFIVPTIKAGAKYENEYLLGTPFSRPLIGKKLVEIAKKEGADAICHGCTGKGNDQVRFELAIKNFDPKMPVIVPWRTWELKSREDEIEYAEKHNLDTTVKLVNNADVILEKLDNVVTSDATILDKCISYFNLSKRIIDEYIDDVNIISLL